MADPSSAVVLEPGTVIGKYRLTTKLGEGGMGVVFVAVHEKLGREVAFKVLKKEFASTEEVAVRFQHEAEAVTRIGHQNIVAVYDFGRLPDGGLYYVMEKVQGETLTRRMRQMPLSESEIRDIFLQLLSALAAAHNLGIVHRDLKPDNIILVDRPPGERPLIKLLDFGVAKVRDDQRAGPLTTAGALLGTPKYMAPEQVKGAQAVDGRADIYAVGVMLYEALCGRAPFEGKMMQLLMAHVGQEPDPPSVRAQQPGGILRERIQWELIDPVTMKALAKDPDQRYQDCRSFAEALDAALRPSIPEQTVSAALPAVAAPTEAARPTKQPRSWGLRVATALLVLGLSGGGVAIVRALRAPSPDEVLSKVTVEAPAENKAPPAAIQGPRGLPEAMVARANQVIDQAQGGGSEARKSVMEAVEAVRSRRFLPRVTTALADDNPAVRRAAAQAALAVGKAGDAELLAALREAAARSTGAVAVEIAAARLGLGEAAVAEELAALARRAADASTRLRAALALSQAGRLPAAQLRAAVAAADKAGGTRPELRRAALARLTLLEDPTILKQIKKALASGDPELILEAAAVLARAGDERGPDLLLQHAAAAREDAATERSKADPAVALAHAGDVRAVPLLLTLLKDPSERARARAAAALGLLGVLGKARPDPQALGPLLEDPKPRVQVAAAVALLGQPD
ncbi:MAG: serine/threonine-protein kinase [Myxococcales bacterium]|nr:serine/threonine protein kinase [Myxococcota bacterium]MDW8280294.1 serine/threonine-protein kinase [Myxococcales bacterium]